MKAFFFNLCVFYDIITVSYCDNCKSIISHTFKYRRPEVKKESIRVYKVFKAVQLVLLIVFFIAFFIYLKTDPVLSNNIFTNTKLLSICVFLWAFMIFSFIAIFMDFRQLEKSITDSDDLNRIAYLDTLTGIPNRISCDIMFQKYDNAPESVISNLACSLICITNLPIINEALGREKGNYLIQDFASIFETVGKEYGFVGRNGGNEFLIVIENCDSDKMNNFITSLADAVKKYNDSSSHMPVTYKTFTAFNSELEKPTFADVITQLYKERG